jgi:hypothetical protein
MGMRSVRSRSAMTTPAAWVEEWRTAPSMARAVSMSSLDLGVAVAEFAEVGVVLELGVEGDAGAAGDHFADAFDLGDGQAHDAADVAQGGLGLHGAEGDDLGDVALAVFAADVFDDFGAALGAEVDVEVGHGDALGVEEALEEEAVLEGVEVGDGEAVGDEAAGAGAAAGADGDAAARGRSG